MFNAALSRLETSVYFFDSRSLDEMWALGDARLQEAPLALGSSTAAAIGGHGLAVDRDDNPPGHGAIVDWPEAKIDYMEVALRLEKVFVLTIREA